jgi:hypothetical protein
MTNLSPSTQTASTAVSIRGQMQAGTVVYPGNIWRAALWHGTAASYVDLHPQGAIASFGTATDGTFQGGAVDWQEQFTIRRATLWAGSAHSYVTLGPPTIPSELHGMAPGVQAGWIGSSPSAVVWYGTRESMVELGPSVGTSKFYATTGRVHVGQWAQQGLARAAVNFGTRDSWLGLHQFVPPGYSFSGAHAVATLGRMVYVGGYAINGSTSQREAFLWIGPHPCWANCDQSTASPALNIDDFTCFVNQFALAQALPHPQQIEHYANCDGSTRFPVLNVDDFTCFINAYASGCP